MATGACGINCSICRLHLRGKCGSCGPASGELADLKIKTQQRTLGAPCPLLACARLNHIDHCLSDCDQFPCENYSSGPYPYSQAFLAMQQRRRQELVELKRQQDSFQLPLEHWQTLRNRDQKLLLTLCGPGSSETGWLTLRLLDKTVRVSPMQERVEEQMEQQGEESWSLAGPLVSQVTVFYLVQAERIGLSGNWLPEHQLNCGAFFRGIHLLPVDRLEERFGKERDGFLERARKLGGTVIQGMGDAAVRFWVLPQVPVKLILWCSDDELPASVSVLFDASIEQVLAADGIWTMVRLLVQRLLEED